MLQGHLLFFITLQGILFAKLPPPCLVTSTINVPTWKRTNHGEGEPPTWRWGFGSRKKTLPWKGGREKILLVLSILKMSFSLASWVFRKHVSVDSVSTYVLFEMLTSCFIILGWRQQDSRCRIGKIRGKILRLNCCKLSAPKIGRSSP